MIPLLCQLSYAAPESEIKYDIRSAMSTAQWKSLFLLTDKVIYPILTAQNKLGERPDYLFFWEEQS